MQKPHTIIFIALLALFLDTTTCGMILPVIMRSMLHTQHLSTTNIVAACAFILSLSPAYYFALPIIGAYSDRGHRKSMLILCISLACLGYFICYIAQVFTINSVFLFGILLFSIAASTLSVYRGIMADVSDGKVLAYSLALFATLTFLEPFSGEISNHLLNISLTEKLTGEKILLSATILELTNLFVIMKFMPETSLQETLSSAIKAMNLTEYILSAYDILTNKPMLILLFLNIIIVFTLGTFIQHTPVHLMTNLYFSASQLSTLDIIQTVLIAIGLVLIFPFLIRYISCYKLIVYGFISAISSYLLNDIADIFHYMPLFWITNSLIALYIILTLPCIWYMLLKHSTKQYAGFIMGICGVIYALFWVLSSMLAVNLSDTVYNILWNILILILIISVFILIKQRRSIFGQSNF